MWSSTAETTSTGTIPGTFCTEGFSNINIAFIISLLVDLGFQVSASFIHRTFAAVITDGGTHVRPDVYALPQLAVLQAAGALSDNERPVRWR